MQTQDSKLHIKQEGHQSRQKQLRQPAAHKMKIGEIRLPKARKVVARVPGVPGISPSLKNAMKCGSKHKVTTVVSRNV